MKPHIPFSAMDVHANQKRYMDGGGKDMGRHPDGRYASFDYCFNYFQSFREQNRVADICSPTISSKAASNSVSTLRVGECCGGRLFSCGGAFDSTGVSWKR